MWRCSGSSANDCSTNIGAAHHGANRCAATNRRTAHRGAHGSTAHYGATDDRPDTRARHDRANSQADN